jgi:hypothetical protein
MFPVGEPLELDYSLGEIWTQKDLVAPFSFPIYRDEAEYTREVKEARKSVYPVFIRHPELEKEQLLKLEDFFSRIQQAIVLRSSALSRPDSAKLADLLSKFEISFSESDWKILKRLLETNRLLPLRENLSRIAQRCWTRGILDRPASSIPREEIAVRLGRYEEIVRAATLYDTPTVSGLLENDLRRDYASEPELIGLAFRIGVPILVPNIRYNNGATDTALTAVVQSVPRTRGFVQENERIVSKNERITEEIWLKLESLRRARADRGEAASLVNQYAGIVLHVLMIVILFGIYLSLFRKRIFAKPGRLLLISIILLIPAFLAFLTRELNVDAPVEYLILVPVASMLLTIIFDSRVGFYGTVITAFLVAGVRGNDYAIALASVVAGALSVYTVRDLRSRNQIFRSMGFIVLGYSVIIGALALERSESASIVLSQLGFGFVNGLISPVLTYGLLIVFERAFSVTTDLTLIELSQFNHPLLRELADKAPGTYHHSMTLASLVEAAAAAIGANDILARVGASFHDVGKIVKPTYFAENQRGTRSRHDKLSPRMSSLIIQAHVKEGIALARAHRLPDEVIDFIPMHHGTTRIEYFYNKALRQAEHADDQTKVDQVIDQDYRYPGPKPQSKETGILMLADAIEASVRTLEDPSPQRIAAGIDEVIARRFEEGELNECPLTLQDLTKIKEAFLRVLTGVYHVRIRYPGTEEKKKGGEPASADAAAEAAGGT